MSFSFSFSREWRFEEGEWRRGSRGQTESYNCYPSCWTGSAAATPRDRKQPADGEQAAAIGCFNDRRAKADGADDGTKLLWIHEVAGLKI